MKVDLVDLGKKVAMTACPENGWNWRLIDEYLNSIEDEWIETSNELPTTEDHLILYANSLHEDRPMLVIPGWYNLSTKKFYSGAYDFDVVKWRKMPCPPL